jgi:hypothetical protein
MQVTLKYAAILKSELKSNRENLNQETKGINNQIRICNISKEIKLFSEYLNIETKLKCSLVALNKESEQYKRCKNAIKDNISPQYIRDHKSKGLRVLNVYHLRNEGLSNIFQVSSSTFSVYCMSQGCINVCMCVRRKHPIVETNPIKFAECSVH